MAIYIDDVKLDLKGNLTDGTKNEQLVKKCIKEIRDRFDGRFPLQIVFAEHLAFDKTYAQGSREWTTKGYPTMRTIGMISYIMLYGVRVKIQYAESDARDAAGNLMPKSKKFKGRMYVAEHDVDLAFYLLYCHPGIGGSVKNDNIELIGETNELKNFVLVDTHKTNADELELSRVRSEAEHYLSLKLSNDQIQKVAIFYGLQGATSKPAEVLRVDMLRMLKVKSQSSENEIDPYVEFMKKYKELAKDSDGVEEDIRSLISKAVDGKMIRAQNKKGGGREWVYSNPKTGGRGGQIQEVMPDMDETESLVKLLLTDDSVRNKLSEWVREHSRK